MFNSNIYSNWSFICLFALHSFGCITFFIDTETVQWSVLMFWGLSWDRRLYNAPDERWREKHVYKDLRNKAQHLCAFFPSCKPSYINFVANFSLEGSQKQLCERGMNDDYNHFYKSLLYLHFSDTTHLKHWTLIDAACAPN